MANPIDALIEYFAPGAALRRRAARNVLAHYDAAKPSRLRKTHRDQSSPNVIVSKSATTLRAQARDLERNHDIARGILRTLVNNVVGPNGIGIEPQPRRKDGSIHEDYAKALREAHRNWQKKPEVTWTHNFSKSQRLVARTWFRDGEAFAQHLIGNVPGLDHGTLVPYSLELFESDMIPMDYEDGDKIRQGIERNAWGRKTHYHILKTHPGDIHGYSYLGKLKRVSADRILQIASLDRIGQLRGISEFASVITRLEDIKDYEESERVAAKIAAALTAYIKKGSPDLYNPEGQLTDNEGNPVAREIGMQPGMILDSLGMGEEIGMIDSNRPNPNLIYFRSGQLKAVAAGTGTSSSSISKNYDGTYSAQRQELVEQWVHYAVLTDEFVGMFVEPTWEKFVMAAHLSGVVPMPDDLDVDTADDALFVGQSMPWIDPYKEALAWHMLVRDGFASEVEVIRKRGGNPRELLEQIAAWRKEVDDRELIFSSDAKRTSDAGTAQDYLRFREDMPETDDTPPATA